MNVCMHKSRTAQGNALRALVCAGLSVLSCCPVFAFGGKEAASDSPLAGTTLNLYTWAGMFPREVLAGFEEETGCRINYGNFDTDEAMLAKLEETNGGGYDFVIADDYILEMVYARGLAQNIDKTRLSNYGNINPVFQSQFFDPDNVFTVPHGAGIPLIAYDPSLTDVHITGYADLWNPALRDNVAVIGNYRVVNGMALKLLGASYNTEDAALLEQAERLMLELAPNIRVISDSNTQDLLLSGEVAAAFMYTSQITLALQANPSLQVVYPREGLGFGIMAGFIPANAPNADAAYAFIDYLLRPEIAAACFEYVGYYCTTKAAEPYISDEMRPFIVLPPEHTNGESIRTVSVETEDLHSRIWTAFRNACSQ